MVSCKPAECIHGYIPPRGIYQATVNGTCRSLKTGSYVQLQPDGALLDEPAAVGQSVERRGERADLLAEFLEQLLARAQRSSRFPAHKQDNITRTASCQPPDLANIGETKPGEPLDLPDPAAMWGLGAVARAPAAAP